MANCENQVCVQFLSSYGWGAFSDRYGRKSVIQIGLASSFLSIIALGLSTTYSAAAWTRFLGGLFNGYLVALKSSIAELFGEEQQAQVLAMRFCRGHVYNLHDLM